MGMCGVCASVCGCTGVCESVRGRDVHYCVHGRVRVCAGVGGSAWVCPGVCGCGGRVRECVHGSVRVCAGVGGSAWVCAGVRECAWVCAGVRGCAQVCGYAWVWDVFSEFLLENRVSTSADFNTYPIRIFLSCY